MSTFKISALMIGAVFAQHAAASGYHFGTQSVGSQSTANAAAAEAADASTIFYNPAGLTHLDGRAEITAATNLVLPTIKYSNAKAVYFNDADTQVSGSNSGKITKNVFAPHVYGAYKINDRISVGLGAYIPFASATEYEKDSVLRYNMNRLGLTTVALEPVMAFKANDQHSFGVGIVAQYSKAKLRKFSDWNASGRLPVPTGTMDGHADVKGDDWGFGYHLGWMFDVNDKVRVGVNYRSKVEHNLRGTAKWQADGQYAKVFAAQGAISQLGYVPSESASVKIVTPESLSVHGMYRANAKLNLFGDVTWTRHSRFNKVDLVFGTTKTVVNGRSNTTTIRPNWRNTVKAAVGASYQYSEPLQLRAGVAFDQSPVRSAEDRLNTLPDGNRIWWSVGARYTYNKRHVIDAAYSFIHINDTTINAARATGSDVDSKGASSANFKNYANIFGLQYTYKF